MILEFTQPFGNFEPGEIIELPDGAEFDRAYLREAPEDAVVAPKAEKPSTSAAKPLYNKKDA